MGKPTLGRGHLPLKFSSYNSHQAFKGSVSAWRSTILLEAVANYPSTHQPAYAGIRTSTESKRKYIEYEGGARELYYLDSDPYELTNRYKAATPPASLASRLRALKNCSADTCRTAENGQ